MPDRVVGDVDEFSSSEVLWGDRVSPPDGQGELPVEPVRPVPVADRSPKPGYDPAMEQRVSLITLGVTDLKRARAFYERLGWRGQEVEETVFFQVGGIALVLWGRDKLALDAGINDEQGGGFGGVVLAHNVRSEAEVEDVIASAERAGATVTRRAACTFYGGYAGYFIDPDGYAWEVAHNPGFMLAEDGSITVPDFSSP